MIPAYFPLLLLTLRALVEHGEVTVDRCDVVAQIVGQNDDTFLSRLIGSKLDRWLRRGE